MSSWLNIAKNLAKNDNGLTKMQEFNMCIKTEHQMDQISKYELTKFDTCIRIRVYNMRMVDFMEKYLCKIMDFFSLNKHNMLITFYHQPEEQKYEKYVQVIGRFRQIVGNIMLNFDDDEKIYCEDWIVVNAFCKEWTDDKSYL